MSKYPPIDSSSYQKAVKAAWGVPFDIKQCFPEEISNWITYKATILGVPKSYLAIPLIIGTAYCAQHATISYEDLHCEPVILYGLVVGRSGTNKSASLKIILDMISSIDNLSGNLPHTFDTGTLEGLMKSLQDNDGCLMAVHDEFASFNDALDKGSSGSSEKSRYLSLYSGTSWSKNTKTKGKSDVIDPRLSLIAYTQPYYATQFARNNFYDGFFQRFLLSMPDEVFISMKDKKLCMAEKQNLIDMKNVLSTIYTECRKEPKDMQLNNEAMDCMINITMKSSSL
eukprot:TCONS_00020809-protein